MKKKEFSDEFDDTWDPNEWQGRSPEKVRRDAKVTGIVIIISGVLIVLIACWHFIAKQFHLS